MSKETKVHDGGRARDRARVGMLVKKNGKERTQLCYLNSTSRDSELATCSSTPVLSQPCNVRARISIVAEAAPMLSLRGMACPE